MAANFSRHGYFAENTAAVKLPIGRSSGVRWASDTMHTGNATSIPVISKRPASTPTEPERRTKTKTDSSIHTASLLALRKRQKNSKTPPRSRKLPTLRITSRPSLLIATTAIQNGRGWMRAVMLPAHATHEHTFNRPLTGGASFLHRRQ